jgi:murein DD-endopeptidase MepM/ murein hydrolase activator NlpD
MTVTGREIISSPHIGVVASGVEQTRNLEQGDLLPLTMPADGYLTRGFDAQQEHYGIDIAGKPGTAIFAAADGSVMFAGWTYEDGFMMIIGHSQGYMTVYKHNQALLKSTAEKVRRGEPIALLGNTGTTSAGPHLHFELWKDGIVCDPDNYLLIPQ